MAGVAAMDVHPSQQYVRGRVRGVVVAAGVHCGVPARVGVGMDVANTVGMETAGSRRGTRTKEGDGQERFVGGGVAAGWEGGTTKGKALGGRTDCCGDRGGFGLDGGREHREGREGRREERRGERRGEERRGGRRGGRRVWDGGALFVGFDAVLREGEFGMVPRFVAVLRPWVDLRLRRLALGKERNHHLGHLCQCGGVVVGVHWGVGGHELDLFVGWRVVCAQWDHSVSDRDDRGGGDYHDVDDGGQVWAIVNVVGSTCGTIANTCFFLFF